jgi:hypothetical protein
MNPVMSQLAGRLRKAETVTAELFSEVVRGACCRLPSLRRTKDFDRLAQLIQSGAWTDATLALLALEAPQWQVRRIVCDEGEWHCALSQQRQLPDWLDEPIAACHPDLCLAILSALVSVRHAEPANTENGVTDFSSFDRSHGLSLCCDNFI